jgi:hypothetical protein
VIVAYARVELDDDFVVFGLPAFEHPTLAFHQIVEKTGGWRKFPLDRWDMPHLSCSWHLRE